MEYNLWDLDRVNIKLNTSFLNKVNKIILAKFKTKRIFHDKFFSSKIPFSTFRDLLKLSHSKKYFVPLEIYIKIANALEINLEELQTNIISYKTANGSNSIESPSLPIIITPVFHMLFAHNIGDGTVINSKKGRLPYFGYRQFNEFYRLSYVKRAEFVFGKIKYYDNYTIKSTRVYLPAVISSLFFKFYDLKVEDFLSERARLPNQILNADKDSKLAVIIGFIIDEGYIDSTQITIGLKNHLLVKDLQAICLDLGYKTTLTNGKGEYVDYSYLHILREGMKKLYLDYSDINKRYPVIDLGIKGERIRASFEIYTRKIMRTVGNQEVIFDVLSNECLSVNQLALRINMTRQGIRYHIHKLLNENKIRIIDKNQLNWIYGI